MTTPTNKAVREALRGARTELWDVWHSGMSEEQFNADPTIQDIDNAIALLDAEAAGVPDDGMCPQCGSGDMQWENISNRHYCRDCHYWEPVNFTTPAEPEAEGDYRITVLENECTIQGQYAVWWKSLPIAYIHDRKHAEAFIAALSKPPAQPDDGTLNQLGVISRAFQKGEALITEETPHTTLGDIIEFVSENAADLVNKKVCPSDSRDKDLIAVRDALKSSLKHMPYASNDRTMTLRGIAIVNRMIEGGK